MPLNAREVESSGGQFDPIEPGSYPARLVKVIDLGVQPQQYNGEEKPPKQELNVTYEFLDEFLQDEDGNDLVDKPRWISERFTLNHLEVDRAKSTARYYALDPKEEHKGDWSKLLGAPCMVTVVNKKGKKDRIYSNVGAISSMRAKDASKATKLINEARFFDWDKPDIEVFNAEPDFIKKLIRGSLEFEGSNLENILSSQPEDVKEGDDGANW